MTSGRGISLWAEGRVPSRGSRRVSRAGDAGPTGTSRQADDHVSRWAAPEGICSPFRVPGQWGQPGASAPPGRELAVTEGVVLIVSSHQGFQGAPLPSRVPTSPPRSA